jgi:hypothetical protein
MRAPSPQKGAQRRNAVGRPGRLSKLILLTLLGVPEVTAPRSLRPRTKTVRARSRSGASSAAHRLRCPRTRRAQGARESGWPAPTRSRLGSDTAETSSSGSDHSLRTVLGNGQSRRRDRWDSRERARGAVDSPGGAKSAVRVVSRLQRRVQRVSHEPRWVLPDVAGEALVGRALDSRPAVGVETVVGQGRYGLSSVRSCQ